MAPRMRRMSDDDGSNAIEISQEIQMRMRSVFELFACSCKLMEQTVACNIRLFSHINTLEFQSAANRKLTD